MTKEKVEFRRSGKDAMDVQFRLGTDAGSGTFEGYLNVWDVTDSWGTNFRKTAYSRGGLETAYSLQDMHSVDSYTRDTLGMFIAAEDDHGLVVEKGRFADTRSGQDARVLAHMAHEFGQPAELSVGFIRLLTADQDDLVDDENPNTITVAKLKESSLIIPHFAATPGAELTSVRAQADELRKLVDSEDLLEPKAESKIIDMLTARYGRQRDLVIRLGFDSNNNSFSAIPAAASTGYTLIGEAGATKATFSSSPNATPSEERVNKSKCTRCGKFVTKPYCGGCGEERTMSDKREVRSDSPITGTLEERIWLVGVAVREWSANHYNFQGDNDWYAYLEGTFSDTAIATVCDWQTSERETWRFPYEILDGVVTLGEPVKAEIVTTVRQEESVDVETHQITVDENSEEAGNSIKASTDEIELSTNSSEADEQDAIKVLAIQRRIALLKLSSIQRLSA